MRRVTLLTLASLLSCIGTLAAANSDSLDPQAAFITLPWGFSASNVSLTVTSGAVPQWLRGSLYRNGPGLYPNVSDPHWFDGLALLQALHFTDGAVSYDANFVGSSTYNQSKPTGASSSFFSSAAFQPSVNTGVTIQELNGHLLSSTATTSSNEFSAVSVGNAACPFVFDDNDAVPFLMGCEHRRKGPDGALYHFAYDPWSIPGQYILYRMREQGLGAPCVREVFASVPYTYGENYQHSFSVTSNYLVLAEPPVPWPTPFNWDAFVMTPNASSYFRVVDLRSGAEVATFEAEGFFYMHAINAYETTTTTDESSGDSGSSIAISIDLISYPDATLLGLLSLRNIFHNFSAIPWSSAKSVRFVLPLPAAAAVDADAAPADASSNAAAPAAATSAPAATSSDPIFVSAVPLGGPPIELPTTNPAFEGLAYRYAYAMGVGGAAHFYDSIIKLDLERLPASVTTWQAAGCIPAEAIFVPRPGSTKEDDGILLSIVIDSNADSSFLLILDARDLSEVSRVQLPQMMPLGFHGIFSSLGVETEFKPAAVALE